MKPPGSATAARRLGAISETSLEIFFFPLDVLQLGFEDDHPKGRKEQAAYAPSIGERGDGERHACCRALALRGGGSKRSHAVRRRWGSAGGASKASRPSSPAGHVRS